MPLKRIFSQPRPLSRAALGCRRPAATGAARVCPCAGTPWGSPPRPCPWSPITRNMHRECFTASRAERTWGHLWRPSRMQIARRNWRVDAMSKANRNCRVVVRWRSWSGRG